MSKFQKLPMYKSVFNFYIKPFDFTGYSGIYLKTHKYEIKNNLFLKSKLPLIISRSNGGISLLYAIISKIK